jgi:hypothetical protein
VNINSGYFHKLLDYQQSRILISLSDNDLRGLNDMCCGEMMKTVWLHLLKIHGGFLCFVLNQLKLYSSQMAVFALLRNQRKRRIIFSSEGSESCFAHSVIFWLAFDQHLMQKRICKVGLFLPYLFSFYGGFAYTFIQ